MTDMINHPPHYTNSPAKCECGRTIECIDVTRHMGFSLGNAVKYIWRADLKGAAIEDLRKAEFYIKDEIKRREAAQSDSLSAREQFEQDMRSGTSAFGVLSNGALAGEAAGRARG